MSYHTLDNSDANSEGDDDFNVENTDKNINADSVEIDNTINEFDAYTSKSDVIKNNIPPQPRCNPSRVATGAEISKLQSYLENTEAYGTLRFTSKYHENIYINNDADDSTSQSSNNDKHDTNIFDDMPATNNKKEIPNTTYSTNIFLHRAMEVMFTQISAKEGIAKSWERVIIAAIVKDFRQLNKEVFLENL